MSRYPAVPKPYVKSGRLAVCLRDSRTGHRRTVYLGKPGTQKPGANTTAFLGEWLAADRVVTPPASAVRRRVEIAGVVAVSEVVLGYFTSIKARHSRDGKLTSHGLVIRVALRVLREEAGDLAAVDFGPKTLRGVRDVMVVTCPLHPDPL